MSFFSEKMAYFSAKIVILSEVFFNFSEQMPYFSEKDRICLGKKYDLIPDNTRFVRHNHDFVRRNRAAFGKKKSYGKKLKKTSLEI